MRGAVGSLARARFCISGRGLLAISGRARKLSDSRDNIVIGAIKHLALVDDHAPAFVGRWTPTLEEYRREACVTPRGTFNAEIGTEWLDPYKLVAADVSSPASQLDSMLPTLM